MDKRVLMPIGRRTGSRAVIEMVAKFMLELIGESKQDKQSMEKAIQKRKRKAAKKMNMKINQQIKEQL